MSGSHKIFDAIHKVTGGKISKEEASKIYEEVKENQRRLKSCEGPHDFHPVDPEEKIRRRYRCSKCQGEVDTVACSWYREGLKHGRAFPE